MTRSALLMLCLLASCSDGPQADLQYIGQARSLAAEWALVNEQAAQGKLRDAYVTAIRASVRDELRTTASSLSEPDSRYGVEIRALIVQPDEAAPDELRAHADKLKQIEDALEST